MTIADTAPRIARGELSPVDLVDGCLARIEARRELNAFITVTAAGALDAARAADAEIAAGKWRGPLHGVPLSLKDLVDQRGVPTTAGSLVVARTPAREDAPLVSALRHAGAVFVGKTNLHECALGTTSDESGFGPVRHALDRDRSPGGSSGGSAVSVATGMALATIGTDTGGSIRIPAACCGLVGLKPRYGEVSVEGVVPLSRTLDHAGPLARSVTDAALVFSALTGHPEGRLPEDRPLRGLRLGLLGGYFTELLEPDVRRAFDERVSRLRDAGVQVEQIELPSAGLVAAVYLHVLFPEAAAYHAETLARAYDRYTPPVGARLAAGRFTLGEDYVRALRGAAVLRAEVDELLRGRDALVLPTLAIEAPPIGSATVSIDGKSHPLRAVMLRLTQLFDITGHPAIALPAGRTSRGLPCSLQLASRDTWDLLATAAACEPLLE